MRHFKLTSETKVNAFGVKLFRIQATVNFKYAKKGDLGGWVDHEDRLGENGWVEENSSVYNNSRVSHSRVYNNSRVENSRVSHSSVSHSSVSHSRVSHSSVDNSRVENNSSVYNSSVYNNSRVENSRVSHSSELDGINLKDSRTFTLQIVHKLTLAGKYIKYGCVKKLSKQVGLN